ncbi:MAG: hypothetical protein WCC36_19285 [Gammaproteobacteria bacterium]
MVQLDTIVVFAVLELLLVLMGLSGFLWLRGRKLARALVSARKAPRPIPVAAQPAPGSYATFLGDELARSSELLAKEEGPAEGGDGEPPAQDGEPQPEEDAEPPAVQGDDALLIVRQKFLENELAAQEAAGDAAEYRGRLLEGLQAIQLTSPAGDQAGPGKFSRRYEEELARLREVIGNQHDIMRELEAIVAVNSGTDETAEEARRKLVLWQQQASELQRCVGVLETENRRLKTEHGEPSGDSQDDREDTDSTDEDDSLRSLIGNQQETINQLQELVQGLVPEAEKASKLTDIIGRIERANKELNTCVVVLEDENDLLRGRVQELESSPPAGGADAEQQAQRVQELEAEIKFKDVAIEELQQQYQSLESKYTALRNKGAGAA